MKKILQTLLTLLIVFILLFALSSVVCADDGISSEEIRENGITWLKETSYGTETWYGIESDPGVFEPGSRFWIKWIDRESDPEAWRNAYDRMDDENKRAVGENTVLLTFGVTAPNGNEYSGLENPVKLYIQLGDDWDASDVQALFVDPGEDEPAEASFRHLLTAGERSPEGYSEYLTVTLRHVGGTLLVGELDAAGDLRPGSTISDAAFPLSWLIVAAVAVLAAFLTVFFVMRKKKTNG